MIQNANFTISCIEWRIFRLFFKAKYDNHTYSAQGFDISVSVLIDFKLDVSNHRAAHQYQAADQYQYLAIEKERIKDIYFASID